MTLLDYASAYFGEDVPIELTTMLGITYLIILLITILGNGSALVLVLRTKNLKNPINTLMKYMYFANIIVGVFSVPYHTLIKVWFLPNFLCSICFSLQVFSSCATVYTLTVIAAIQCRAVTCPMSIIPKNRNIRLLIITIWTASLIIALPTIVDRKVVPINNDPYNDEPLDEAICLYNNLSNEFMNTYSIMLSVVQYFIPLMLISALYGKIAHKLWKINVVGNLPPNTERFIKKKRKKAIKLVIAIAILFGIFWLPMQIYNIFVHFDHSITTYKYIYLVWFFCDCFSMLNCCSMPFIYILYNEKYSTELRNLLDKLRMVFNRRPPSNNDIAMIEI